MTSILDKAAVIAEGLVKSRGTTEQAIARSIRGALFDKQSALDRDTARRLAGFCTRRAGKTVFVPSRLVSRAVTEPESVRVYLAITRVRAKELIWRPLEIINERYQLGAKANDTLGTFTLPNHAVIRLRGADDKSEAQKGRGDKLAEVIIDEAQIFPSETLQLMIEDVYGPTLEDVGGQIIVLGTPGIVCAGKWYEMTQEERAKRERGWSVHQWSVLDNPFMAHMKARLPEMKAERGWADDNPTYLREWCGKWVNDTSALFYSGFDPSRNLHDRPEESLRGGEWMHSLGWDIGLRDAMALTVWAFHPHEPDAYEAWSWKRSDWRPTDVPTDEIARQVGLLQARGFNFRSMVADTGGLGALVVQEFNQRHRELRVFFEAAKKSEKHAHVELLNADFRAGRAKLRRGSVYALEIAVLPKDPGDPMKPPDTNKLPEEDPRFPNHSCDSGLYGWRAAQHWLAEPLPTPPPPFNSAAWHATISEKQRVDVESHFDEVARQNREAREDVDEW